MECDVCYIYPASSIGIWIYHWGKISSHFNGILALFHWQRFLTIFFHFRRTLADTYTLYVSLCDLWCALPNVLCEYSTMHGQKHTHNNKDKESHIFTRAPIALATDEREKTTDKNLWSLCSSSFSSIAIIIIHSLFISFVLHIERFAALYPRYIFRATVFT